MVLVSLMVCAVACVAFGLARLLSGYWQIRQLRASSVLINDPKLSAGLAECAKRLGMTGTVAAAETRSLGSAAVIGWRQPLMLLPPGWKSWTSEERNAVLAHELAHVKRRDFVATAFGQLAVAINFYHPLAHIVMQRFQLDQELAADTLASEIVGGQQRYVELLAGLALRQTKVRTPGPCQAFLPPRHMFVRRLEMLRNLPRTDLWINRLYSALAAACLVIVALSATGLKPHTLVAQETAGTAGNATAKSSVTQYVPAGLWEAVVYVDAKSLLVTEGARAIRKQGSIPDKFEIYGYEIALDDVSEMALVVFEFPKGSSDPLLLIRSKKTFSDAPKFSQVRKLDENTLAIHSQQEVLGLLGIAGGDKKLQSMLDRNSESHIRIASQTTWVQMLAKQVADQGTVMAFAPLWTKVDSISMGFTLSKNLDMTAQLDSTDPKRVAETLTAAKFLARNYLEGISAPRGEAGVTPTQIVSAGVAAQAGNQLLESLEIKDSKDGLVMTAQMPDAVYRMIGMALPAISAARTAAQRTASMNNMTQMLLGLHNYHDAYGHLPPAVVVDKKSGAQRSWRVELLPFLEHSDLYEKYRKDEPWDSEANKLILNQMPSVFAVTGTSGTNTTPYLAIVSEDGGLTMKDGREPKFVDISDGLSNTIFLVETTKLVPWTQPVDLSDAANAPLLGTSRKSDPGIIAAMGDGSVKFIGNNIDLKIWQALITRSGGEEYRPN